MYGVARCRSLPPLIAVQVQLASTDCPRSPLAPCTHSSASYILKFGIHRQRSRWWYNVWAPPRSYGQSYGLRRRLSASQQAQSPRLNAHLLRTPLRAHA